jgi:hypothetical protein
MTTLDQKLERRRDRLVCDQCLVLAFGAQGAAKTSSTRPARARRGSCRRFTSTSAHGDVTLLQRAGAELGFGVLISLLASRTEDARAGACRTRRPGA